MSVQVPSSNLLMDDEDDVPPDLDLDLWEGQFEFVGRGYVAPVEDDDDVLDLFPAVPKPGHNGDSRNKAYLWAGTLTNQVGALQQQMAVLTEQQSGTSERYARARHEAGVLQARVHMLEEQLREAEIRAEERLTQEQARHKEVVLRLERERQLQHENNSIKLQNVESEVKTLRTETQNLRSQLEELRHEKRLTLEELTTSEAQCETLRQQVEELKTTHSRSETIINDERAINSQLMNEIKSFREREENSKTDRGESQDEMGDLQTMSSYVNILRHENAKLRETNEELEAQLLNNTSIQNTEVSGNIAEELQDIKNENLSKAMQEQKDVNLQLKNYIENLLKMIMERNPQMLEIK